MRFVHSRVVWQVRAELSSSPNNVTPNTGCADRHASLMPAVAPLVATPWGVSRSLLTWLIVIHIAIIAAITTHFKELKPALLSFYFRSLPPQTFYSVSERHAYGFAAPAHLKTRTRENAARDNYTLFACTLAGNLRCKLSLHLQIHSSRCAVSEQRRP